MRFNVPVTSTWRACPLFIFRGFIGVVVLADKVFQEMFTTYSHALCPSSPAGETEIGFKIDEKNGTMQSPKKIFLTRKLKRVRGRTENGRSDQ